MKPDVVFRSQRDGRFLVMLTTTQHVENMGCMVVRETDGSVDTLQPQEIISQDQLGFYVWHLTERGHKVAIVA